MKTNCFFLYATVWLMVSVWLLSALPMRAQTFLGNQAQIPAPKGLQALICSAARPASLRINFDNPAVASVRVIIRDENGNKVFDEFEKKARYRGYFDLSSLPLGNYIVELSTMHEHITKTVTLDQPLPGTMAMSHRPDASIAERPVDKSLLVSH